VTVRNVVADAPVLSSLTVVEGDATGAAVFAVVAAGAGTVTTLLCPFEPLELELLPATPVRALLAA
jgi:hypothetical protein